MLMSFDDVGWHYGDMLMIFDGFVHDIWWVLICFLCGTCDELFMNVDDVWCNYDDMLMIFDEFVDNIWWVLIMFDEFCHFLV